METRERIVQLVMDRPSTTKQILTEVSEQPYSIWKRVQVLAVLRELAAQGEIEEYRRPKCHKWYHKTRTPEDYGWS